MLHDTAHPVNTPLPSGEFLLSERTGDLVFYNHDQCRISGGSAGLERSGEIEQGMQKNGRVNAARFCPAIPKSKANDDGKADLEKNKAGWVMPQVVQMRARKHQCA
jgi:hypothetical protein